MFVADDEITGVLDWPEVSWGDPISIWRPWPSGQEEHLVDVIAVYGAGVDLDVICAWWSVRSLLFSRGLIEHRIDPAMSGCEFDVLGASR
ncbi:hypothetical protein Acsp02_90330 [Actinoplanes sp. NBRC 103695]|nr:hypothetical protein Acsp02_90330 [Actinoplanes sp. NBRC 103695]